MAGKCLAKPSAPTPSMDTTGHVKRPYLFLCKILAFVTSWPLLVHLACPDSMLTPTVAFITITKSDHLSLKFWFAFHAAL